MLNHLDLGHTLAFVERHGYALLFFWVLAEQSALPLPSVPLLLAVGTLSHTGRLHLLPAIACSIIAALIADTVWFAVGRRGGRHVLRLICRISLEPESCVRQTENAFVKYGMRSLLVSKFIPGLNAVAAPLAGHSRSSYPRFVTYDSAGALLWSAAYLGAGYVFSDQLEDMIGYASRMGSNLVLLVIALIGLWIGWKLLQRRRFLKQLDVARITPAELQEFLDAGEDLFIVDLRSSLTEEPELIPGAVRMRVDELSTRSHEIPRDRDIILFCS